MKHIIKRTGPIGAKVSALLILAAVCLALLAIILLSAGVYESVSNPQMTLDASQVCSFVPENGGQTQEGISGPVANVTGR